ncbi:MAG: hypothetical protein ACT4P6_14055 [Gemmatimonadaceae bacterium]
MKKWQSGFRGAGAMILLWIIGWGVGFGGLIEAFVDPHGELIDIWPAAMAFAGFVGGIVFSALLWISDRGRSFDEVSLARIATWGVVTGLMLGVLAALMGLTQDIAIDQPYVRPVAPAVMIAITIALGAVAAIGSALFFRLIAHGETRTVSGR